jgi:NAD(P)-dependent dehydrogenase (short-subunit alcohol dehydrogenase family)
MRRRGRGGHREDKTMTGGAGGELTGQVALVTGASRGIGRAIALALAAAGLDLGLAARGQEALQAVAGEVRALGCRCVAVATDVGEPAEVDRLVTRVLAELGRVDILVNNAGVGARGTVEESAVEDWQRVLATNLTGPYLCSRAVLPAMRRQGGGAIVNISSGAGKTGYAGMAAYCASKFGLMGFTEALAAEVGDLGIKVSTICPGTTVTEFGGRPPKRQAGVKVLLPEDVASAVVYLLRQSPQAWTSEMTLWPFRELPA